MVELPRIVIFEDQDKNFKLLLDALRSELADNFQVVRYEGNRELKDGKWSDAEKWVRDSLLEPRPAVLAVIDWDLSGFRHPAPQQFIRGIAEDQAIPTVLYQSQENSNRKLERLRRWQERRIAVEASQHQVTLASVCADAARGFATIRSRINELSEQPRLMETLRDLLKPPSDAPLHLEQFAVGNQELLRMAGTEPGADSQRFIATWIGYLIHNRILAFPGPILNRVATAAYLSIAKDELDTPEVQEQISSARYAGPFAGAGYWWASSLDAVIAGVTTKGDATIPTGRAALERLINRKLRPAKCHEGEDLDEAAFLCVLTNDIVCRRHSDAPDAWIPQGADRCRIHADEFEMLRAWLGV